MHPLGFAYYPDGALGFGGHAEVPELEHPTPDDCAKAEFACNPGADVSLVAGTPKLPVVGTPKLAIVKQAPLVRVE